MTCTLSRPSGFNMAAFSILQYPNRVLKSRSRKVKAVDRRVKEVIADLLDALAASPGVALAAPQIGKLDRIIVCDVARKKGLKDKHHGLIVLINPVLRRKEGQRVFREGCLSVPDYTGNVLRAERVWVEGMDQRGKLIEIASEGFEALALQHELDHLDGRLFLDRISSLSTDLFRRKTS